MMKIVVFKFTNSLNTTIIHDLEEDDDDEDGDDDNGDDHGDNHQ